MEIKRTERNFPVADFVDFYGVPCSLQISSLAGTQCVWLGINNADPQIMASKVTHGGTGWVKYPLHPDVCISTRMHLSRDQVAELLPHLQKFVETGEI